jgi:nitrate reductase molybdenum cofactor assembly chaperone
MISEDSRVERLSSLLEYPDGSFARTIAECAARLSAACPRAAANLERFSDAVEGLSIDRLRELYVETFDMSPDCTLDLGWHLYRDAYERGALLASLREELQRARIREGDELPDHLPHLLKLLERLERPRAEELRRLLEPAIERLETALAERNSPYVYLVKSAIEALDGE